MGPAEVSGAMNLGQGRSETCARDADASALVAVLADDASYRAAVVDALAQRDTLTCASDLDGRALSALEGWHATWRPLNEVGAVIIDITGHVRRGLRQLEVVRRRDWTMPVVLVIRNLAALPRRRLGANMVLEGEVAPGEVAAAASMLAERRCADDGREELARADG